jgi:hypothetical protein
LAVLALYAPVLHAGFVNWDDDRFITANPLFHGSVWGYVAAAFTRVQFQAYHPLHILSYLPDRLLWPTWAAGFHALNVIIFAAAIVCAFLLVRRLTGPGPAALACLLLACHPLAVESVAWITSRKEVLGLLLAVTVLHVEDDEPRSRRAAVLGPVLGVAACLTKTSWVVLPILVFAWQCYARQRPWRLGLRRALPYAITAVLLSVPVPFIWHDSKMIPSGRPLSLPFDVLGTLGLYAQRAVWPHNLSAIYPAAPAGQLTAGLLLSAGLTAIVLLWRRLPSAARFAAVTFFGCLLPVSNLIPLYWRFADRYVLPALFALLFPAAALLATLHRRARPVLIIVVALLAAEVVTTRNLIPAWHDSLALWRRATKVQPDAPFAHVKLGETALEAKQWAEAAAAYTHMAQTDRHSLLGPAGLLKTVSSRAEAEGKLPQGTYTKWQAALTRPGLDATSLSNLIDEAIASPCRNCGPAMLWLALRIFPQSDANLMARARQAAARGQADLAWVLIREMKDRSAIEHTRLGAAGLPSLDP